jgi:hypothetical protein
MPRRVLITLDAVGGVWRYAIDVARGLEARGIACLLVGFGPPPGAAQRAECDRSELVWTHEPLDWTVSDSAALDRGTDVLACLARDWNADILHLNLPSQASGLPDHCPVVVAHTPACRPGGAPSTAPNFRPFGRGRPSATKTGSNTPMPSSYRAKATPPR